MFDEVFNVGGVVIGVHVEDVGSHARVLPTNPSPSLYMIRRGGFIILMISL
jgi:hypothetical protein